MRTRHVVLALLLVGCSAQNDEGKVRMPSSVDNGGGMTAATGDGGSGGVSGTGGSPGTSGSMGDDVDASGTRGEDDGGATTASNGTNTGGVSGNGGNTSGDGCACQADERCTPEGRCEPACACDDTQGACDEGCACDYACGPATCAPFANTFEHASLITRGGLDLWDRDTGIMFGVRSALERRGGLWSHLRGWGSERVSQAAMDSPTSAWLVGDGIVRLKDGKWSRPAGFESVSLYQVRLSPDGYGIAVGDANDPTTVLLLEGEQWSVGNPGTGLGEYWTADVVNGGDIWLATSTHLVQRKDGVWKATSSALPILRAISLVDADNGWAHAGTSALYRLVEGEWSPTPAATLDGTVKELSVDAAGRGYAITEASSFYALQNGEWEKMSKMPCPPLAGECGGKPLGLAFVDDFALVLEDYGFWTLEGTDTAWRFQKFEGQTLADLTAIAFAGSTAHVTSVAENWLRKSVRTWEPIGRPGVGLSVGVGASVVWAAGEDGLLAYYDETDGRWYGASGFDPNDGTQSPLTDANLYGIAMNADESGWAVGGDVGTKGVVLRRTTAGKWIKHGFAPSAELHAIALESTDTGWAVGGGSLGGSSVIARLDAGAWTEIVSPTALPLWGVALDRHGDGWAVGGTVSPMVSVVLRLKDGKWSVVESVKPVSTLRAVAIDANGYGWAVGTGAPGAGAVGVALHGESAQVCPAAFDRFASRDAYGVAIDGEGRSWVVGADGFRAHSP